MKKFTLVVLIGLLASVAARGDPPKAQKGQDAVQAPPLQTTAPVHHSGVARFYPNQATGLPVQPRFRQYPLASPGNQIASHYPAQNQSNTLPSQFTHWRARHSDDAAGSPEAGKNSGNSARNNLPSQPGVPAKVVPATNADVTSYRKHGTPVVSFNNNSNLSFADACRRDHHHPHDRDWWRTHCASIIFIGGCYFGFDNGWWYPAFGYDSSYTSYAYGLPVYGYDGLPPDQVIANVQGALQEMGYFPYAVDGVLGPVTQQAIADFQRDQGIYANGAIDRATLSALGFID